MTTIADPNGRTIFVDDCAYHIHIDPDGDSTYFVGAFNECPFAHDDRYPVTISGYIDASPQFAAEVLGIRYPSVTDEP